MRIASFYLPEYRGQVQLGTGLSRVRLPAAGEVLAIQVFCETAGAGTDPTEFDVKIAGVSVFNVASNRPRIQPGELASNLAVPNAAARLFTGNELLTLDCTQVSEIVPTNVSIILNLGLDDVLLQIAATEIQKLLHTHYQSTPSSTWSITHNLNRHPRVTVVDSSGNEQHCEVDYPDLNTAVVTTAAAFSGRADLV